MEGIPNWDKMSWQEKRDERFKTWLNAPGIEFVDDEAEKLYRQRVARFVKAIKMEEPDRVPVFLPSGTYPAYYAGIDFRTLMYDYDAMKNAWIKFMDDFGDMDTYMGPSLIPSGIIAKVIESKTTALPGLGLPDNASINQIIEGEYMMADEYDAFMMDPTDFHLRVMLPRTAGIFESFKNLPSLRYVQGAAWISILSEPGIRKTLQTLMDLEDENRKHMTAMMEVNQYIIRRGYTSLFGGGTMSRGVMANAPFDHFADMLRGTRGIAMDMFRQPEKLKEAMECWLNILLSQVKDFPMTDSPICIMPLHKGDDTFMSDKQFEEFYWPTLRRLFLAMIEEGLVPLPFAEGRYTNRLKSINDTPKSGVVWWFDQTDMAQAKKMLGNTSCILGNVPTSVVMTGTVEQVKENCRRLIETCAPGGGYILGGGAAIDNGKFENLKAMMEAAYEYGMYM